MNARHAELLKRIRAVFERATAAATPGEDRRSLIEETADLLLEIEGAFEDAEEWSIDAFT